MAGCVNVGAAFMIVDPTAPSYVKRVLDEARLFSECDDGKRNKQVLNGATIVPLEMTTFKKLGSSAKGLFQTLVDVARSTLVAHRGSWLRIAQQ